MPPVPRPVAGGLGSCPEGRVCVHASVDPGLGIARCVLCRPRERAGNVLPWGGVPGSGVPKPRLSSSGGSGEEEGVPPSPQARPLSACSSAGPWWDPDAHSALLPSGMGPHPVLLRPDAPGVSGSLSCPALRGAVPLGPLGDAGPRLHPRRGAPRAATVASQGSTAQLLWTRPLAGAPAASSGLGACEWSLCPHRGGRTGCPLPLWAPEPSVMQFCETGSAVPSWPFSRINTMTCQEALLELGHIRKMRDYFYYGFVGGAGLRAQGSAVPSGQMAGSAGLTPPLNPPVALGAAVQGRASRWPSGLGQGLG